MDNGRLGPVNTLDISHHAAPMAMDRCGCDSLEAARQFIRDASLVVYIPFCV